MVLAAGATVVIVSIGWTKFTDKPEPEALSKIRDIALETSVGTKVADVLGVSDDLQIDVSSVAGSLVGAVGNAVKSKATDIVIHQAIEQISSQYNNLSSDQKKQIQELICKPPS